MAFETVFQKQKHANGLTPFVDSFDLDLLVANAATPTNSTLTGAATPDGVTLTNGVSIVAVFNQTDPTQNGLYIYNSGGAWPRHSRFNASNQWAHPFQVVVLAGTTLGGSIWTLTSTVTTLGTDPITFLPAGSTGGGGGGTPTGTGFYHVTSGTMDPAARAVNLASADVTGVLASSNGGAIAAGSAGTFQRSNGSVWVSSNILAGDVTSAILPTITLTGDTTGSASGGSITTTTVKINGATVPVAGSLVTGNGLYASGTSALSYSALNLAGGSGWVTGVLPLGNVGAPTGTGFPHITSGAWDSAARAVNLATADVTGVLPTGNQASQTLGGSLSGTTASGAVVQFDGSGTTDDFGGTGATGNVVPIETIFGSGTNHPVLSGNEGVTTTDGVTWTTVAQYTPPNNTGGDVALTVFGVDVTGGAATGDFYRADIFYTSIRVGSGAPNLNPATPTPQSPRSVTTAGGGAPSARVQISGNAVQIQVLGPAASRTWHWSCIPQIQRVS